jgi:protein-tyrosine phosphatase
MSEAILKNLIRQNNLEEKIVVESAGTEALVGISPDDNAMKVCEKNGIDIKNHKARQLTNDLLRNSEIIICLADNHKRIIKSALPEASKRVFLLKEFLLPETPSSVSISDPTGKAKKKYEQCFKEINTEIERIFPFLQKQALEE